MPVIAYLNFNGNTEEAVRFYHEVFATEASHIQYFRDMPGHEADSELGNRVLHARITVHGSPLFFSDSMPQNPVTHGDGITLAIVNDDAELLLQQFNKLAEKGRVLMPIQETFWSKAYGIVQDHYGIQWQFSHEVSE